MPGLHLLLTRAVLHVVFAVCHNDCGVQVQAEFQTKFAEKAKTANAHALDRTFGPRLKYQMEYCISNPGEISKVHRVKSKVDEVKGIMVQNIEKVRWWSLTGMTAPSDLPGGAQARTTLVSASLSG